MFIFCLKQIVVRICKSGLSLIKIQCFVAMSSNNFDLSNTLRIDESSKELKIIKLLPQREKKLKGVESYSNKRIKIKRSEIEDEPTTSAEASDTSSGPKRGFFFRKEKELAAKRLSVKKAVEC